MLPQDKAKNTNLNQTNVIPKFNLNDDSPFKPIFIPVSISGLNQNIETRRPSKY